MDQPDPGAGSSGNIELDRDFYTLLRSQADDVVPVVGAGLAVGAGLPSFSDLVDRLVTTAAALGHRNPPLTIDTLFETVDRLADQLSSDWVAETTAEILTRHTATPTPALRALARVPSRLILTTNYDLAIEEAARSVGQRVVTLTAAGLPVALQPPGVELRVVHLHGVVTDPGSIVLSKSSYEEALEDEQVQLLLRAIAARYQLVFLGHSLSDREVHLRRDIAWSITNYPPTRERQHLLITDRESIDDAQAVRFKTGIEQATQVTVVLAEDPKRAFTATLRTASVLAGLGSDATEDLAPVMGQAAFDRFYLPQPVGETKEVSDPEGHGRYMATVWQHGETHSTALDVRESRLLIVAGGGYGKTEELRQIGRRAKAPALFQHLSAFNTDQPWGDAGRRFVAGMSRAQAPRDATPQLTAERLCDESYVFLLDALDEVPSARRPGVTRLIREVADTYPQHRFVLTSRPIPGGFEDLREFNQWTPLPDNTWLKKYCESRGLTIGELTEALPDTGDVSDLIQIPIYANAAVSRVHAGKPLPPTSLVLVLDLADHRMRIDQRIEADTTQLRVWLNRLALCMVLSETTDVATESLIDSGLAQDLPGLTDGPELIDLVASRALLTDAEGSVRFPANVVREARAARAILDAKEQGLQLLRDHVLIELPTTHGDGRPVRTIRPSWVPILEQLLPLAPLPWHDEIALFDPLLVARSTSTTADEATRHAAIWTIWDGYVEDRIWIQSRRGGDGTGDEEAMHRLVRAGAPDDFVTTLVDAMADPERTVRGNALRLLPHTNLDDEHLRPIITAAIIDADSVVRRHAAVAARARDYRELVSPMVAQAQADPDESAAHTLLDFAMDLADDSEAIDLARALTGRLARRACRELARRLPRNRVLELALAGEHLDQVLLHELLKESPIHNDTSWTVEDVVTLARAAGAHPNELPPHEADRILQQHPGPAILSLITQPAAEVSTWDVHRLASHLDDEAIHHLVAALQDPSEANLAEAGYPEDRVDLDETARLDTLNALRNLQLRKRSSNTADGILGELDAASGTDEESLPAPHPTDRDIDIDIDGWQQQLGVAAERPIRTPRHSFGEPRLAAKLRAAAKAGEELTVRDCINLTKFLLSYDDEDLTTWLQEKWKPEAIGVLNELGQLGDSVLTRLPIVLPGPWPVALAEKVLDAVDRSTLRLGHRLTAVAAVARAATAGIVREWAAARNVDWIDPALVRLGDCEAETRLVTRLVEAPSRIRRYSEACDEEWISALRCPSTAGPLAALLVAARAAGVEHLEVQGIAQALTRCAGLDAPGIWDTLIAGPEASAPGFLLYDKRAAIAGLVDRQEPAPTFTDPALQNRARAMVTYSQSDRRPLAPYAHTTT